MDSPILIKNKFNNGYLTFERIGIENVRSGKSNLFVINDRNRPGQEANRRRRHIPHSRQDKQLIILNLRHCNSFRRLIRRQENLADAMAICPPRLRGLE